MFAAWGRFVYRHRRAVAVVTLVFTVLMGISASSVMSHLSSGGWIVKDAPSWGIQERLDAEFGTGGAALVAIFPERISLNEAAGDPRLAELFENCPAVKAWAALPSWPVHYMAALACAQPIS